MAFVRMVHHYRFVFLPSLSSSYLSPYQSSVSVRRISLLSVVPSHPLRYHHRSSCLLYHHPRHAIPTRASPISLHLRPHWLASLCIRTCLCSLPSVPHTSPSVPRPCPLCVIPPSYPLLPHHPSATIPIAVFAEKNSSRRTPLVLGILALLGAQVLLMEAPNYPLMAIARVFQGISSSMIWIIGLALLYRTPP